MKCPIERKKLVKHIWYTHTKHTSALLMSPLSSSIATISTELSGMYDAGPWRVGTLGHAHCLLIAAGSYQDKWTR